MPLSCGCYDYDGDGPVWWFPSDFSVLSTKRGRRCKNCKALIKVGSTVSEFKKTRAPKTDIEERIYGDTCEAVPMAPDYLCERCSDIWFNLYYRGFECVTPDEVTDCHEDLIDLEHGHHSVTK